MHRYEQHCPIARAAEVITEPWTVLIVRELLRGNERRPDIAKGLPRMSASLLAARLRALEQRGLVACLAGDRGEKRYKLTVAGQELRPIVDQLGRWGQRWLDRPRLGDLDPELLVYDICREIDRARLPDRPLTVDVDFTDATQPRRWWLSLSATEINIRQVTTPIGATVRLTCTLGALAGVWLGHVTWLQAVREQAIMLGGEAAAIRSLIECLGLSRYAKVPRAESPT
ncbi:MAG TPA: helix-turn-helix domain-containing protein [Actinophytocola sp.]|jgi:DNA-binding HxlR family transcriptional regulator|uniref:winged helix-turn-helix transcriptional regulator n=1 Tax=Actinophytocola sp. TaxID=1872138 RepID=UPI002F92A0CA